MSSECEQLRARITGLVARIESLSRDRVARDEELAQLRPLAQRAESAEVRAESLHSALVEAQVAARIAEQARLRAEELLAEKEEELEKALRAADRARTRVKKLTAEVQRLSVAQEEESERVSVPVRETVVFDYQGADRKKTSRTVELSSVYRIGHTVYLEGRCALRNSQRTFRVSRIYGDIMITGTGELVAPEIFVGRYL